MGVTTKERNKDLLIAAKQIADIYSHIWDRVDGALVLFPQSIPKFEDAMAALEAAIQRVEE